MSTADAGRQSSSARLKRLSRERLVWALSAGVLSLAGTIIVGVVWDRQAFFAEPVDPAEQAEFSLAAATLEAGQPDKLVLSASQVDPTVEAVRIVSNELGIDETVSSVDLRTGVELPAVSETVGVFSLNVTANGRPLAELPVAVTLPQEAGGAWVPKVQVLRSGRSPSAVDLFVGLFDSDRPLVPARIETDALATIVVNEQVYAAELGIPAGQWKSEPAPMPLVIRPEAAYHVVASVVVGQQTESGPQQTIRWEELPQAFQQLRLLAAPPRQPAWAVGSVFAPVTVYYVNGFGEKVAPPSAATVTISSDAPLYWRPSGGNYSDRIAFDQGTSEARVEVYGRQSGSATLSFDGTWQEVTPARVVIDFEFPWHYLLLAGCGALIGWCVVRFKELGNATQWSQKEWILTGAEALLVFIGGIVLYWLYVEHAIKLLPGVVMFVGPAPALFIGIAGGMAGLGLFQVLRNAVFGAAAN